MKDLKALCKRDYKLSEYEPGPDKTIEPGSHLLLIPMKLFILPYFVIKMLFTYSKIKAINLEVTI